MSIKSALARHSGAFAVTLLALSFSVGGSYAVRADDPEVSISILRELVVEPIMKAVSGLEQRLTNLEGGLALFAASFSSHQINTRELCVSDNSGAQTCITKAQLDAVLMRMAHAEAKEIDGKEPAAAVSVTSAEVPAESVEIHAGMETAAETAPAAIEPTESVKIDENAKAEEPDVTGSVTIAASGAALVWYPDVEVSTPAVLPQEE